MRYISTFTNSTFMIGVASEPGRGPQQRGLGRGEKPAGPGPGGQRNTDDYVAFEARTPTDDGGEVAVPVVAVAAGVATQGRDERLSQVAIEAIYAVLRSEKTLAIGPRLVEALHAANQVLYQQARLDPSLAGKGATAVAAAILQQTLYLAYIGDCRVYLLREGVAHPLTLPPQRLPTPEPEPRLALPTAPWGAPVVTAPLLGSAEFIDVATAIAPLGPEAQPTAVPVTTLRLQATDTLIFCTPGLYQVITDQELAQVAGSMPAQEAAWRLADLAAAAEAAESYTVLIVQPTVAQPEPAPVVRRAPPTRRVRQLRRAVLIAACFLVVALSWSSLVEQGGRLAALVGAQIPQSLFSALAQERGPKAVAEPGSTDAAALPVADAVKTDLVLPTPAPTLAPVAVARVAPVNDAIAGDDRVAAAAAEPPQAVSVVLGQRLAQFVATSSQKNLANLRNTISVIGAAAAAGRTATAVAVAALPTPTPTLTPTPVPPTPTPLPPKPTPTPRPRATKAAAAPANRSPDFSQARVTLVEPVEFDTLIDKRPFRWQANFTLPPGYAFELVFWQRNQDPLRQGRGYAGLSEKPTVNASYEHFRIREAPEGEYRWGVLLVTKEPYRRIKFLGGGAVIYVKRE